MSYDLWFWNQKTACKQPPKEICLALSTGKSVDEIEEIDIEGFVDKIVEKFPGIEKANHKKTGELIQLILDPEETDWSLFVEWSRNHLVVQSYSAPGEILNDFIDIAVEFDCRLYDPQTGERYSG